MEYVALDHADLPAIGHLAFQLAAIFVLLLIFFGIRRWTFGRRATYRGLSIGKLNGRGLVWAKDNGKFPELAINGNTHDSAEVDGDPPGNRPGQPDSTGGASKPPDSAEEEQVHLRRLLEQQKTYIRQLESRVLGPAGSTLIFERTYEGSVRSDEGDEVVVRYYDAVEDDIIDQVYGKDQFKEGNSPGVGRQVTTCVQMYQSDSSDDGDGAEYEFRPREIISGRVEL